MAACFSHRLLPHTIGQRSTRKAASWQNLVKEKQQIQLRLVIQNLGVQEINRNEKLYDSVMRAWKDSLELLENLLRGVSHSLHEGGPLLALLSWHLYPDLILVHPVVKNICQNDHLLSQSGSLTLGLKLSHEEEGGLRWSLPLAYLRHYGRPVLRQSSTNDSQRLTVSEFMYAFLGAFIAGSRGFGKDLHRHIRWLDNLHQIIKMENKSGSTQAKRILDGCERGNWLGLLFKASQNFLATSGREETRAMSLIQLGRRHGQTFLGIQKSPLFGLAAKGEYLSFVKSEDERVDMLRQVAQDLPGNEVDYLIKVKHIPVKDVSAIFTHEYATAKLNHQRTLKRKCNQIPASVHSRWLSSGFIYPAGSSSRGLKTLEAIFAFTEIILKDEPRAKNIRSECRLSDAKQNVEEAGPALHYWFDKLFSNLTPKCGVFRDELLYSFGSSETNQKVQEVRYAVAKVTEKVIFPYLCTESHTRAERYEAAGETVYRKDPSFERDEDWKESFLHPSNDVLPPCLWFDHIYGDENASLFFRRSNLTHIFAIKKRLKHIEEHIFSLFEKAELDEKILLSKLTDFLFKQDSNSADPYWHYMSAVSAAIKLIDSSPDATIDVRVFEHSLRNLDWVHALPLATSDIFETAPEHARSTNPPYPGCISSKLAEYHMTASVAFACLCFCESAHLNLDPIQLCEVMAMSSGNSLYISHFLLRDPVDVSPTSPIKRFVGNIGRSGIALMVPPSQPLVKEKCIEDFRRIVHRTFDGELRDSFKDTSLHLGFTPAEQALDVGFSGQRHQEVFKVETLLRVFDRGEWIADLNVEQGMNNGNYVILKECHASNHIKDAPPNSRITCIDTWAELIQEPNDDVVIIRAHKNWQARLASSIVWAVKGLDTVVMPHKFCWTCFNEKRLGRKTPVAIVV